MQILTPDWLHETLHCNRIPHWNRHFACEKWWCIAMPPARWRRALHLIPIVPYPWAGTQLLHLSAPLVCVKHSRCKASAGVNPNSGHPKEIPLRGTGRTFIHWAFYLTAIRRGMSCNHSHTGNSVRTKITIKRDISMWCFPSDCMYLAQEREISVNTATGLCSSGCMGPWWHRPLRSSICMKSWYAQVSHN